MSTRSTAFKLFLLNPPILLSQFSLLSPSLIVELGFRDDEVE